MSRISAAFKEKAFIAFLTGGDPTLEKTELYIDALIEGGADLIEIGVPFSDPIAEGSVIQDANLRALKNPLDLDRLLALVSSVRRRSEVPLVFLTYLNPLHHYGYARFFAAAAAAGLDGVIVPDLPFEEQMELREPANAAGVEVISLIAPTSAARVKAIAEQAQGFLYLVSSMGVTGVRDQLSANLAEMTELIKQHASVPCAIGFGIHSAEQARDMAQLADGVIVGSAIVKMIEGQAADLPEQLRDYARQMKAAALGAGSS